MATKTVHQRPNYMTSLTDSLDWVERKFEERRPPATAAECELFRIYARKLAAILKDMP